MGERNNNPNGPNNLMTLITLITLLGPFVERWGARGRVRQRQRRRSGQTV